MCGMMVQKILHKKENIFLIRSCESYKQTLLIEVIDKKRTLKYGSYLISLKLFLEVVDPFCSRKGLIFTENQANKFFVHFSDEPLDCYDWVEGSEQLIPIKNPIFTIMTCRLHI